MKTIIKVLAALVVIFVILLGVAVWAGLSAIDSLARKGVESGATYALDVPTTLKKADVGIRAGTFTMDGLNVTNPEGFDDPNFLSLGQGHVSVKFATLLDEVVELPNLRLSNLEINLQQGGGQSNYGVILENLKRFESDGEAGGESGGSKPASDESGKKFIIQQIDIEQVNVHVSFAPPIGDAIKMDIPIPSITLTDIGTVENGGVKISEVVDIVIKAILGTVSQIGGDILPADLLGGLQSGLGDLTSLSDLGIDVTGDLGEVVSDITGQAQETVEKATEEVTKAAEETVEKAEEAVEEAVDEGLKKLFGDDK